MTIFKQYIIIKKSFAATILVSLVCFFTGHVLVGVAVILLELLFKLFRTDYLILDLLTGKKVRKIRFYYLYEGLTAEIGVFQDELLGLVEVDFEFQSAKDLEKFKMPDFCLADVTQENFAVGGMLCGKNYSDIESELKKFNYKKLFLQK